MQDADRHRDHREHGAHHRVRPAKSTAKLTARTNITASDLTLNDSSFGATTTIGGITLGIVDARDGSAVTLKAGTVSGSGGDILTGNVLLIASTIDANAINGSVTLGTLNSSGNNSKASLGSKTDVKANDVTLTGSSLKATAGGGITLGSWSKRRFNC